jgi:predicted enzyme related to lactoylglutathione lyase
MDNTVVHFEIPADQPERAAQFYRELFGGTIKRWVRLAGWNRLLVRANRPY